LARYGSRMRPCCAHAFVGGIVEVKGHFVRVLHKHRRIRVIHFTVPEEPERGPWRTIGDITSAPHSPSSPPTSTHPQSSRYCSVVRCPALEHARKSPVLPCPNDWLRLACLGSTATLARTYSDNVPRIKFTHSATAFSHLGPTTSFSPTLPERCVYSGDQNPRCVQK